MLLAIHVWWGNCRELLTQSLIRTAGATWFKKAGVCPNWSSRHSLKCQVTVTAEQAPCECSADIPKILHSPCYLEERFSALPNYIKIQFDWQMSVFSTIDANFINWLCCQRKCPYTPSHCFSRWTSRETARMCVCLTYTFTNISILYWNLTHKSNKEGKSIWGTATDVWQDLSHLTLDIQSVGVSIWASQAVLLL